MLKNIIMKFLGTLVKILSGGLATLTLYVDQPVEKKNLNIVKWAIANGHLDVDARVVTITSAVVEEYNNSKDTSLIGMMSLLKARTADQQSRAISVRFEIPDETPDNDDNNHMESNDETSFDGSDNETSIEPEEESSWDDGWDDDDEDSCWGNDDEDSDNEESESKPEESTSDNNEEPTPDATTSDEEENTDNKDEEEEEDEFGTDDESAEEEKKPVKMFFGNKFKRVDKTSESDTLIPEMPKRIHDAIISMAEWNLQSDTQFAGVFPISIFNAKDRIMDMAKLRKIMEDNGVTKFNVRTDLKQITTQMIPYNSNCWYFPTRILAEVAQNYGGVLRYTLKDSTFTAFIVYNGEVYAPGKGWNYEKPLENVRKLDRVYGKEPFDGLDHMLRQKKLICRTKCSEILG